MVRIKVGPKVDRDLYEEFKQLVKNRYGQTRGVLGIELDNALKNHIDQLRTRVSTTDNQPVTDQASMIENPDAHTHTKPQSENEKFIMDFKNEFTGKKEITHKQLEQFIIVNEDIKDPRAIDRRIKLLESHELIKPVGDGGVYENLLVSELSQDTIKLQEEYYRIVKTYFRDNNIDKIDKLEIKRLPPNIRDPLVGLDADKFDEFVE